MKAGETEGTGGPSREGRGHAAATAEAAARRTQGEGSAAATAEPAEKAKAATAAAAAAAGAEGGLTATAAPAAEPQLLLGPHLPQTGVLGARRLTWARSGLLRAERAPKASTASYALE